MSLSELVRTLYGVDRPQGCTEAEIAAVRERFGALPAAVEDFWRTFGHTKQLNFGQDDWVFPTHYAKWTWLEEIDALVLLNENQSVGQACVRRTDLALPDPPVYLWIGPDGPWELSSPTFSAFLEAALTYEAVWQLPCSPEEIFELSEADRKVVQTRLTRRPTVLKNWFFSEVTFYSSRPDNLVVVMDMGNGEYQATYGGATKESYTALLEVMEGLGAPI
ncbi:MAG: hypothetical protein HFF50_06565 [Lawsonibacter sp.]|nr:hypothetical protein [Lawsonibacter sp.]